LTDRANLAEPRRRAGEFMMSILTPLHPYASNIPPLTKAEATAALEVSSEAPFETFDRWTRATISQITAGLSPAALALAFADWTLHLASAPGKQFDLTRQAIEVTIGNLAFAARSVSGAKQDAGGLALPQDPRFRGPLWQRPPFNLYAHNFLSIERWWEAATTGVRGVSRHHENVMKFTMRQFLDTVAPSNFILTNPLVLDRTRTECGMNLLRGLSNWILDSARARSGAWLESEDFKVGDTVATTPGKVVHRTHLAEIIQYAPLTDRVRPEPVVIVPAWIMKYYILDLSPNNSLVRFLLQQGFTVFMISWKNPGTEDRDIGFDEYRRAGVLPAIDAAIAITGARKVHAVGYCIGGTLLAIAAAAMVRDGDDRLASLTFFAAQTDFTEAGELMLFIDESEVTFLEDMMWERGYLDAREMAGAFQLLRSNDLIWSRSIHAYLMGERSTPIDIMAWNADSTRMPYRMHSEYLRSLFLENRLAEGRFEVDGRPIALPDLRLPIFVVATERDHVAPWRSVFKFCLLTDAEITFVLTNGGHNAGILSEPGHPGRHFRIATHGHGTSYVDPDTWLSEYRPRKGSWWPAWSAWLAARSAESIAPPSLGDETTGFAPLEDAPGRYVFMR
jgi:polyhydroxyalkanoate synthase